MNLVYLPVDEDFTDVVGEPWKTSRLDDALNLREVLTHTVRRCPVNNGGDAERTYELLQAIRREESNGFIELRKDDYDWMVAHIKETGHQVWLAPDAAHLVHYLQDHVTNRVVDDG